MSELNIYQRINEVMSKVSYIKKDANIGTYKAVTRDAVVSLLREELVRAGVVVETSQISGEWITLKDLNATPQPVKMGLYKGLYSVSFVNIDNPKEDRAVIQIEAHANDNGDKAPGKAATYAEKTALLKQFLLETGLNDEERQEQSITQEQADQFGYLVESGDEMGLFMFMSQFPPESQQRKELFDSVPYGQKGKIKEGFLELSGKAHKVFDEVAISIKRGIEKDDEQLIFENWDELPKEQKLAVWNRLDLEDKEFLKSRKLNNE